MRFLLATLLLLLPSLCLAEQASTVTDALIAKDKTEVILSGHLSQRISKYGFVFQDHTGEIEVKIQDQIFGNLTITPETKIKITGAVERASTGDPKIEVKTLELDK